MEKYDDESEVVPDLVAYVSDDEDEEHVHKVTENPKRFTLDDFLKSNKVKKYEKPVNNVPKDVSKPTKLTFDDFLKSNMVNLCKDHRNVKVCSSKPAEEYDLDIYLKDN